LVFGDTTRQTGCPPFLEETLQEEEATDRLLSKIAESVVNPQAAAER